MQWHWYCSLILALFFSAKVIGKSNSKLKEQFAIEGTSYKVKCPEMVANTNSSSPPYLVWSVNGRPPRGQKYKLLQDGLVIKNISKEDTSANYTCIALDRQTFLPTRAERVVLKIRQREAKLFEPKASFNETTKEKVEIWGVSNQWKTLQCRIFSRPSPVFTWINENGEKIKTVQDLYKITEDETTSNLTIFLHNDTLFGEYKCTASNVHGESTQTFTLGKGYKPKAPFIFPTSIQKEKVFVKVKPQEEITPEEAFLPVKYYFVQFAKADTLKNLGETSEHRTKWTTITKSLEPERTATSIEIFELKNLKSNTTYLLRSAVGNAAAVSDFSSTVRVTTDAQREMQTSMTPGNETVEEEETKPMESNREAYGRSADDDLITNRNDTKFITTAKGQASDGKCSNPKFRKTVIITTTSTTLIESIDDSENSLNGNSSLIKKRIEEDTNITHMNLCNIF